MRTRRKLTLAVLGIIGLCICVTVAVVAYSIEQEKKEIRDKYGSDVAKFCEEPGGGAADVANFSNADAEIRFLVLAGDGTYDDWHDKLPTDVRATGKENLDVVVCKVKSEKQIESCPYTDVNDENKVLFTINRVQPVLDVVLLSPAGTRIAERTLLGGIPDKCPDEARGSKDSVQTKRGAEVSYNDFYTELTAFVSSVQAQ
jgi:hypothetical protein